MPSTQAAGADVVARGELLAGAEAVVRVGRPTADEVAELASGTVLIGFLSPLTDQAGIERLAARGVVALRDGVDSADHARTVHGRALLAGERGGLQGGADRSRPAAEVLPTPDDRRRDGCSGQGARARRRRRRAAGDRNGSPARSGHHRVRRAAGRPGAGREPRRDLPRPRSPERGDGGRLRRASSRRRSRADSRTLSPSRSRRSTP